MVCVLAGRTRNVSARTRSSSRRRPAASSRAAPHKISKTRSRSWTANAPVGTRPSLRSRGFVLCPVSISALVMNHVGDHHHIQDRTDAGIYPTGTITLPLTTSTSSSSSLVVEGSTTTASATVPLAGTVIQLPLNAFSIYIYVYLSWFLSPSQTRRSLLYPHQLPLHRRVNPVSLLAVWSVSRLQQAQRQSA